jgi:hypothetical protein
VGAFVSGGTNVTVTYDDSGDVLTVSATDTNTDTQLTEEEVQDVVGAFVSGGTNVTVSYSDSGDVLTVSADHDHAGDTLGTASSRVTTAHVGKTDTEELSITESGSGEKYTKTLVRTADLDGSASVTANALPTHDRYRLIVSDINASAGGWGLRVNGDTGTNYDYISFSGTTSGATEWKLGATGGKNPTGDVTVRGYWRNSCTYTNNLGTYDDNVGGGGQNKAVSSPLASITVFQMGGSNFDSGTVHLVGEDMVIR